MNDRTFLIMREPGPRARRTAGLFRQPYHHRVGKITAGSARDALAEFVKVRFLDPSHVQYDGHLFEWMGQRSRTWKPDDRDETANRRWSVLVTLTNGRSTHLSRFEAWEFYDDGKDDR